MKQKKKEKEIMQITQRAYNSIINFIGSKPAETGGALFGKPDDYVVRKFMPDHKAKTSRATYSIDTDYINPLIKKMWDEEGLALIGIIHSHPHGYKSLSGPDMRYFGDLLTDSIKRKKFYAPVVFTIPDGGFEMHPHVLDSKGRFVETATIQIASEDYGEVDRSKAKTDSTSDRKESVISNQTVKKTGIVTACLATAIITGYYVLKYLPVSTFISKIIK